jgi:hypothetical protein
MTLKGHIRNGQIILDEPANLADGTPVRVEVETPSAPADTTRSVWDDLLELAGTAEGLPSDFAENHDHYIHGTPKRKPQ